MKDNPTGKSVADARMYYKYNIGIANAKVASQPVNDYYDLDYVGNITIGIKSTYGT